MAAPIIYFNGISGVGKLAVAKLVQARLQDHNNKVGLIDNHSLIDPVAKKYQRGHPEYHAKRREVRLAALNPVGEEPALRDSICIFTDSQPEYNECVRDHHQMALASGRRFYSVVLTCSEDENQRRIVSPGRGKPQNTKLNAAGCVRFAYRQGKTCSYRFGGSDELVMDTTEWSAEETANRVVAWFEEKQKEVDEGSEFGKSSESSESSESSMGSEESEGESEEHVVWKRYDSYETADDGKIYDSDGDDDDSDCPFGY